MKQRGGLFGESSEVTTASRSSLKDVHATEAYLKTLPVLSFRVMKTNLKGRVQSRIVRLLQSGIENIKSGKKVTNFHPYEDVLRCYLKDNENFIIEYKKDHDFFYSSEVATQIVREIKWRVNVHRMLGKKVMNFNAALRYRKLENRQSDGISSNPTLMCSPGSVPAFVDIMHIPHESVTQLALSGIPLRDRRDTQYSVSDDEGGDLISPRIKHNVSQRRKLEYLTGTTEDQRLRERIDHIVFDATSEIGSMVAGFIKNSDRLFQNHDSPVSAVRQFVDYVRTVLLESHREELEELQIVKEVPMNYVGSGPAPVSLAGVIEQSLQGAVVSRLREPLFVFIRQQSADEETRIKATIATVKGQPQSVFGIRTKFRSSNNFSAATLELSAMSSTNVPAEMLRTLLACARAVYKAVKDEHGAPVSTQLAADDFLPILVYVTCHCAAEHLAACKTIMWDLCDPRDLNDEAGYYLTSFSSALMHIAAWKTGDLKAQPVSSEQINVDMEDLLSISSVSSLISGFSESGSTGEDDEYRRVSDMVKDLFKLPTIQGSGRLNKDSDSSSSGTTDDGDGALRLDRELVVGVADLLSSLEMQGMIRAVDRKELSKLEIGHTKPDLGRRAFKRRLLELLSVEGAQFSLRGYRSSSDQGLVSGGSDLMEDAAARSSMASAAGRRVKRAIDALLSGSSSEPASSPFDVDKSKVGKATLVVQSAESTAAQAVDSAESLARSSSGETGSREQILRSESAEGGGGLSVVSSLPSLPSASRLSNSKSSSHTPEPGSSLPRRSTLSLEQLRVGSEVGVGSANDSGSTRRDESLGLIEVTYGEG